MSLRWLLACALTTSTAAFGDPTLSYSGRLADATGKPLAGPVTLEIRFFDDITGGSQKGPTVPFANTQLADGVFHVDVDLAPDDVDAVFGSGSTAVYVEVTAAGKTYPRQRFIGVPFALRIPIDSEKFAFDSAGRLTLQASDLGALDLGSQATLGLGTYSDAQETTLVSGGLTTADKGTTWFNSDVNQIKYWNGSAVETLGIAGGGIQSFGGLTANDQFFAVDRVGTSLAVSSATATHTLHIPMANAGAGVLGGLISNADHVSFSAKVDRSGDTIQSLEVTNALTLNGMAAPSGVAGKGRLYFDSGSSKFMVSENNGAAVPLIYALPAIGAGGTAVKVTYDVYGRITGASTLTAGDIPNLDAAKITTGQLPVANGGTGSSTLTANGILLGNGTSAVTASTLTNGQLLVGSTGAAPVANTLTGTSNQIVVTNSAGSITLSTPQDLATSSTPTFARSFLGAGTAASPGLTSINDTGADTGVFWPGTPAGNNLALATAGAERLRVDATGKVAIGTAAAEGVLHVSSDADTHFYLDRFDNLAAGPTFASRKARGTAATPLAVQDNDYLMNLSARAHDGTAFSTASAAIRVNASENWTPAAQGSRISLWTTPNGSPVSAIAERVRLTDSGRLGIGSTNPQSLLDVAGTVTATGLKISTSPASGHVLTSDAAGVATWQAPAAAAWGTPGAIGATTPSTGAFTGVSIGTTTAGTDLYFGAGASRAISVAPNAAAGNGLTIQAGGTSAGSGDFDGGNLVLSSGNAIGTGSSKIEFKTASGGAPVTSMTILGNGFVGMGTTNPLDMLQVGTGTAGISALHVRADNTACNILPCLRTGAGDSLVMSPGNSQFLYLNWDGGTSGGVKFGNGAASEVMRVQANGNVGIGTVNPVNRLQIEGGNVKIDTTTANAFDRWIGANSTNALAIDPNAGLMLSSSVDQVFFIDSDGNQTTRSFQFRTDGTSAGALGTELMRIVDTGNVGIGTSGPNQGLTLYRTAANSFVQTVNSATGAGAGDGVVLGVDTGGEAILSQQENLKLRLQTNATDRLTILGSGEVGIGTTAPGAKLQIESPLHTKLILREGDATGGQRSHVQFVDSSGAQTGLFGVYSTGDMYWATKNTASAMTVKDSGNVGIGTTNPQAMLQVAGGNILLDNTRGLSILSAGSVASSVVSLTGSNNLQLSSPAASGSMQYFVPNATGAHQFLTNGAERLTILNGGNVGVGTNNPAVPFHLLSSELEVGRFEGSYGTAHASAGSILRVVNSSPVDNRATLRFEKQNAADSAKVYGDMRLNNAGDLEIAVGTNAATLTPAELVVAASGNVGVATTSPGAKLHVVGEIRATDSSGAGRLWGKGRPGAVRYGTSGVEAGLCTNGAVSFGLSLASTNWGSAADACPLGTWVCSDAERGTASCNTTRTDDASDGKLCNGSDLDFSSSTHRGWLADVATNASGKVRYEDGTYVEHEPCISYPAWCCSE